MITVNRELLEQAGAGDAALQAFETLKHSLGKPEVPLSMFLYELPVLEVAEYMETLVDGPTGRKVIAWCAYEVVNFMPDPVCKGAATLAWGHANGQITVTDLSKAHKRIRGHKPKHSWSDSQKAACDLVHLATMPKAIPDGSIARALLLMERVVMTRLPESSIAAQVRELVDKMQIRFLKQVLGE